jgi:hypothetical protein
MRWENGSDARAQDIDANCEVHTYPNMVYIVHTLVPCDLIERCDGKMDMTCALRILEGQRFTNATFAAQCEHKPRLWVTALSTKETDNWWTDIEDNVSPNQSLYRETKDHIRHLSYRPFIMAASNVSNVGTNHDTGARDEFSAETKIYQMSARIPRR